MLSNKQKISYDEKEGLWGEVLNMPPVNTVVLSPFDDTSTIDKKVKITIQIYI